MSLPRLDLPTLQTGLRRPAVLATVTTLALAGLLGAGAVVAAATGSGPFSAPEASDTATSAEPASSPSPDPQTTSGGDDNVAVAVNTRDGSTVYAVRLKVVVTSADVVDSGNAAVAAASCSDCQTVAIALEGVIVTGDAEVIAPENIALAINSGCSGCQTLAYAYQNLQTVDGKVRLTGAGRATIGALRRQLNALRNSGLGIEQVKAEVDRIAGEFAAVLSSEVVPIGEPAPDAEAPTAGATRKASREPTATPSPDAASPSPAATSPSPSPAAELTESPTPGPSPTPTG